MTINDYDAVMALWMKTEGLKLDESDEFENMGYYLERNPGLSFVAVLDNKIIGTIKCGHDGRRGYIYHLVINTQHKGNGISKRLYQKSIEELKRQRINKCNLYVLSSNKSGLEYWEHNGWKIIDPDLKMLQRDLGEGN
jgi:ribosomal protein S18 acetylase RimI-like enzyme